MEIDELRFRVERLEKLFTSIKLPDVNGEPEYVTIADAARRLSVHHSTIRRAIQSGRIRATNITPGSSKASWRIAVRDLQGFVANNVVVKRPYKCSFLGI